MENKKSPGRPPKYKDKMKSMLIYVPDNLRDALDKKSIDTGLDKSEITRQALKKELKSYLKNN